MSKTTLLMTPERWRSEWLAIGGHIRFATGPDGSGIFAIEPPNPNLLNDAGCKEVARLTWLREQQPLRSALASYLHNYEVEF